MTTRPSIEPHRTATSTTSGADPALPLKRLKAMGYQTLVDPEDGWLTASQLFPWHSLFVVNPPDRAPCGGLEHLGLVMARRRYGLNFDLEKNARPAHILSCNLPVATPENAAHLLLEEAMTCTGARSEALKLAALHGLAHLERGVRGRPPVAAGRFLQVLRSVDLPSEGDAARAGLHLIARHRRIDGLEFAGRLVLHENPELRLSAIDALLWLGEPGLHALQEASIKARGDALKTLKAVESGLGHDIDPMHRLLTSDDWTERNGAVRVLRSLVVQKGLAPEGPVEILLSRFRDDTDNDNRTSIGFCLGDLIAHMGPAAVDPVVALLGLVAELQGDSEPLINGILFGGAPGLTVARVSDLMGSIPRIRRIKTSLHRLLAVVSPDYPTNIRDWLESDVVQGIQWNASIPAPVRAWFEDAASVPPSQVLDAMLDGSRHLHDGSLASAAAEASPSLSTAVECLLPRLMNQGQDTQWTGMTSLMTSSWTPHGIPLAWMRTAIGGLKAGPPLTESPENIGSLLAVAGSSLQGSGDQALEMLAAMSPATRSLAVQLLRALPVGITNLNGPACQPPTTGFGPRERDFPGLGPVPSRPMTALLPASLQQFFHSSPSWMTSDEALDLLLQLGKQGVDGFKGEVWRWEDEETRDELRDVPTVRVQRAIVALHLAGGCSKTVARLTRALGTRATEGDLGPLIESWIQSETGSEALSCTDDDDFDEILRDLA